MTGSKKGRRFTRIPRPNAEGDPVRARTFRLPDSYFRFLEGRGEKTPSDALRRILKHAMWDAAEEQKVADEERRREDLAKSLASDLND